MRPEGRFGLSIACVALIATGMLTASAAPPAVDAKGLPAEWAAVPIGDDTTVPDKQAASYENGVLTVQAGGAGLEGDTDGGVFVYRKGLGAGSIRARLVTQADGADDGLTQTGVAIREGLEDGARVVRINYTSGNLLQASARTTADTAAYPVGDPGSESNGLYGNGTAVSPPAGRKIGSGIWIGLERVGDSLRHYYSSDGKVWNEVASSTIALPSEILIGIEASKHGGDGLATSTLDNISVTAETIAPRALTGVSYLPRDKSVVVTWLPVAVADGEVTYNVYRVTKNGGSPVKLTNQPIKGSSYVAEGLTNGEKYYFAVSAVVGGVESGLQMPAPNGTNQNGGRRIGVAIPGPSVLNGMQMYHIGIEDAATVKVEGEGATAKITLRGAGTNVWQTGDGVPFLAIPVEGDIDVSARFVRGPTASEGGGWEHGGIMIRETLDPGSRFIYAEVPLSNRLEFKRRRGLNQQNTVTFVERDDNAARPVSVRLVRRGDTFECSYSQDSGANWKPLGDPGSSNLAESSKDTITGFAKAPYVGLTICPHWIGTDGQYSEAEIDQFVLKPAQ